MSASASALAWIQYYQEYQDEQYPTPYPSKKIIDNLLQFVPPYPIRLYRGITSPTLLVDVTTTTRKLFTSWSKNIRVAHSYSVNDSSHPHGVIMTALFAPSSILCDTTLIDGLPHQEDEVMIFPGTYRVQAMEYVLYSDENARALNEQRVELANQLKEEDENDLLQQVEQLADSNE